MLQSISIVFCYLRLSQTISAYRSLKTTSLAEVYALDLSTSSSSDELKEKSLVDWWQKYNEKEKKFKNYCSQLESQTWLQLMWSSDISIINWKRKRKALKEMKKNPLWALIVLISHQSAYKYNKFSAHHQRIFIVEIITLLRVDEGEARLQSSLKVLELN